jgi:hypothetical protein
MVRRLASARLTACGCWRGSPTSGCSWTGRRNVRYRKPGSPFAGGGGLPGNGSYRLSVCVGVNLCDVRSRPCVDPASRPSPHRNRPRWRSNCCCSNCRRRCRLPIPSRCSPTTNSTSSTSPCCRPGTTRSRRCRPSGTNSWCRWRCRAMRPSWNGSRDVVGRVGQSADGRLTGMASLPIGQEFTEMVHLAHPGLRDLRAGSRETWHR